MVDSKPEPETRRLTCAVDNCEEGVGVLMLGISLSQMTASQPTPLCPDHSFELGKFMTALLHESE